MPLQPHNRLLYSTDGTASGRVAGSKPGASARVAGRGTPEARLPDDGVVRIARDKKGRGGKTATTVTGLPGTEDELDALLKRLKSTLGSGGTREGRGLVLQGDLRERLMKELTALGHKPKLAGG